MIRFFKILTSTTRSKYDIIMVFLAALASTVDRTPPFMLLQTIDEVHRHRVALVLRHQ